MLSSSSSLFVTTILFFFFFLITAITSLPSPNCDDEKCGDLKLPFPFHINPSCSSLSSSFLLTCINSTSLFLNLTSQPHRVLSFFPDSSLLLDLSSATSPPCRDYNNLNSLSSLRDSRHLGVSEDNVLGLYDCDSDSDLCKAECEGIEMAGCGGARGGSGCCYPLWDGSVWHVGEGFGVFEEMGCRGVASWGVKRGERVGRRGVKVEWAVPEASEESVCGRNGYRVDVTAVKGGVRCLCEEGFVGDGFARGKGCVKSCIKDNKEVYGDQCNDDNNNKKHNDKKLLIIGGVLSSSLIVASFVALFCLQKRSGEFDTFQNNFHSDISLQRSCKTRLFTYSEIEAATKGFEDTQKLVEDLNSTMYHGLLLDGSRIAVQKIHCANESDIVQVLSEIELLSSVKHRNLACLLGCCIDMPYTPLVIYEYPPNGTLAEHLHRTKDSKPVLDWPKRLSIAAETASVLAFLHYKISPPMFHRDLKLGSIFLDENLSVKVAGFGLITPSPPCNKAARFQKNDVCDMGLLLLEMIMGPNKAFDNPALALQKIRDGKLEEIVDPQLFELGKKGTRCEQIESVADLAMRCVLFGGDGKIGMVDVARELGQIGRDNGVEVGTSKRGPEETFSNSSLLQMISMSPDSIYLP